MSKPKTIARQVNEEISQDTITNKDKASESDPENDLHNGSEESSESSS